MTITSSLRSRIKAVGAPRAHPGLLPALVAGVMIAFATPKPADALTITATYGTGSASVSAAAQAVIGNAIQFYQNTFSDPISVLIQFNNMSSGLGSSNFWVYASTYSTYLGALTADATSADDATALAGLPVGPNNPVTNNTTMAVKGANGRAVGLNTPAFAGLGCNAGATLDGCIGLNIGLTTTGGGGPYSLFAVVEHEIDEILGLGSALSGLNRPNTPWTNDLFRYASPGVRSFATNVCGSEPAAYLSIDNGATNLDQFNNCNNGGDYGDWITHTPSQVQDAFTNGTGNPALDLGSPETRTLDVIGYTLTPQPVPEPISLVLFGTGLAGAAAARRRARKNSNKNSK